MIEHKLTTEQKSEVAELAAELGDFDHWYYDRDSDCYGENGQTLEDTIDEIKAKYTLACEAIEVLRQLGLTDSKVCTHCGVQVDGEIQDGHGNCFCAECYAEETEKVMDRCS
jgi:hypothetical protein